MTNKILFVDNSAREFLNFRGFIAETYISKGISVFLLCPNITDNKVVEKLEKMGIEIYHYEQKAKTSPYHDLKLLCRFITVYRKVQPDLIIHYTIKPNIYGSIAAKYNNIKCISVIPGLGSVFQTRSLTRVIVSLLYRVSLKIPCKVWVLNKDDFNLLTDNRFVALDKIEIMPGEGIDTDFYKSKTLYTRSTIFKFLFVGRIIREKGVEVLSSASRILRSRGIQNYEINLIGGFDGSLSSGSLTIDDIRRWESEKLINYIGQVSNVTDYIDASDCVVLPSFYGEGLPRSLMEASSMQRVAITTNNVGCRDVIIDNVNGFIVEPQSAVSLADKMMEVMVLDENTLRSMGEAGRNMMVNKFNKELIISYYSDLLSSKEC